MDKRVIFAGTLFLVIIILGLYKCGIALFEYKGIQKGEFNAEIIDYQKSTKYNDVYKAKIGKQYFLLYVKNYSNGSNKESNKKFEIGDIVQINAEYREPAGKRNEGGFDYKLYLKSKKISGSFYADSAKKVGENKSSKAKYRKLIYKVRQNIIENYQKNLKKENSSLIAALTVGDKSSLEKDEISEFKDASLSHILAISGAHFAYIILMINYIKDILKRKRFSQILLIFVVLFFIELTGKSPSVIRAGIMEIMAILASLCFRKSDFLTSLSITLLIQIFNNPYVIFDVGLILSYFGTIGIVYFYEMINEKIKTASVTIAANLMILPIMLYNFNTFSLSFIVSNFFASILLGPTIIVGILSNIIRIKPVFAILNLLLSTFRKMVEICAKFPLSKIYVKTPSIISILIYYLILYIVWKKWSVKKNNNYEKSLLDKIKVKKLLSFLVILIIFSNLNYSVMFAKLKDDLLINFVDVGQGDSTLIRYDGKNILIDGGGSTDNTYNVGENVLLPYLLDKKINRIDYLIFSHFDTDHCQGLIYLIGKIKVKNAILGLQAEDYENYKELLTEAKKKNVNVIYVQKGDKINIQKNLYFDVIWPSSKNLIANNSINNNSLVCKLNFYKFSMLFTGDIEKEAEEAILNNELKSTILKVAHHGSNTSTTDEFLEAVSPKIALIGVGVNNKFNHPSDSTIKKLELKKCQIYRTDQMGEISIRVTKNGNIKISKFIK